MSYSPLRRWLAGVLVLSLVGVAAVASRAVPATGRSGPDDQPSLIVPGISAVAQPSAPAVRVRDPAFEALPGAAARWGTYEGGAYRIEVPDNWNGGLVMYAHGYPGEGPEVSVSNPPLRSHLIAGGYAWAASSFRGAGYRPDWGVEDTLALRELFIREAGAPRWTIIDGDSMGGHIVVSSLELHPEVYQGGLAGCGAVTGIGVIDYLTAYGAAAEYISGVPLLDAPNALEFARLVNAVWLPAMGRPGAYTAKGRRFDSVVKYLMGGDLPLRTEGLARRYTNNLLLLAIDLRTRATPAGRAAGTRHVRYRIDKGLGLSEEELNANVRRFDPMPGARTAEENPVFADMAGRIAVPLLTLHTTGDAWVPFSLEQDYRRKTMEAGTSDLLVQRAIRRPGHCEFSPAEMTRAFDDLVAWVERGIKPDGDDVLTPDLGAIGLRWTSPLYPGDPSRR